MVMVKEIEKTREEMIIRENLEMNIKKMRENIEKQDEMIIRKERVDL